MNYGKTIIEKLAPDLKKMGYHGSVIKKGQNTYHFFNFEQGSIVYAQYFRIMRSSYVMCDSGVEIYSKDINNIIQQISPGYSVNRYFHGTLISPVDAIPTFSVNMSSISHKNNFKSVNDSFRWNRTYIYDIKLNDNGNSEFVIADKIEKIKECFVKSFFNLVLPRTNTIEKIDELLNGNPLIIEKTGKIPVVSACFPFQQQITMGLITANLLERADRVELSKKYMDALKSFSETAPSQDYIKLGLIMGKYYGYD